jgi:hypothetical protein
MTSTKTHHRHVDLGATTIDRIRRHMKLRRMRPSSRPRRA